MIVQWRSRVIELSVICNGLRLNGVKPDGVRKRFIVEDEQNGAQYRALWNTIGKV